MQPTHILPFVLEISRKTRILDGHRRTERWMDDPKPEDLIINLYIQIFKNKQIIDLALIEHIILQCHYAAYLDKVGPTLFTANTELFLRGLEC